MEGSYQKFYECIILNKLLKKPWSMIFFFVCFKEGTEVFTKMRLNDWINWLDRRIRVNFNKLNWHLCSISKKHSLYKVLCYLTSRGKQQRKNHLYWWCVKRMLHFDTNNINEECTLKMYTWLWQCWTVR